MVEQPTPGKEANLTGDGVTVADMPRRETQLTPTEIRELERWGTRLDRADRERDELRRSFAEWVRAMGPAAVARELGISRSAMDQRLRALEGRRRK